MLGDGRLIKRRIRDGKGITCKSRLNVKMDIIEHRSTFSILYVFPRKLPSSC